MLDDKPGADLSKIQPQSSGGTPADPKFILYCLADSKRGDGILYARLHCGKYSFNKTARCWMSFDGHSWQPDIMDEHFNAAEAVALKYESLLPVIDPQIREVISADHDAELVQLKKIKTKLESRVWRLRSVRGVKACVNAARRVQAADGRYPMITQGGSNGTF